MQMGFGFLDEDTTSSLAQEFRQQVTAFVRGELSFDGLYLWIAEFGPELADNADAGTRKLQTRVWGVIGEYGYGNMAEGSVRRELAELLASLSGAVETRVTGSTVQTIHISLTLSKLHAGQSRATAYVS